MLIGSKVAKHRTIVLHLLSAHALTGCDTVASYFGIGKTKVVKALEAGHRLSHLGNLMASLEDVFVNQRHLLQHAMVRNVKFMRQ